jgi:hypothetical protein
MTGFDWSMSLHPNVYQWSDAWLLLSIIYASRDHPATFGEILMLGDYTNHTSFTTDEFENGTARLKMDDLIKHTADGFLASERTLNAYATISKKGLTARGELKEIELFLGIKNAP